MFQYIIPNGTHEAVIWVVLAISIVCGLVMGYFVMKNKEAVLGILLGVYSGYILGQIIYQTFLRSFEWYPRLIQFFSYFACIIVFCVISYFLYKHIVIISTSLCGSYAFVRGISIFEGSFPNETTLIDLINNKEFEQLGKLLTIAVYVYWIFIVVWFFVGCYLQYWLNKSDEDIEEEKEKQRQKWTGNDNQDNKNYFRVN